MFFYLINMSAEVKPKEKGKPRVNAEEVNTVIVRIASTDLKGYNKVSKALTLIKGISDMFSNAILKVGGINSGKKVESLTEDEIKKIDDIIKSPQNYNIPEFLFNRRLDPETMQSNHIIGNDLRLQNDFDIRRLKRIRSYKGVRHSMGLKVRGQRLKRYRKGGAAIAKKKVKLK